MLTAFTMLDMAVFFSCDLPRKGPDSGVYHSPDGGETWRLITDVPQVVALQVMHL